MDTRGVTPRVWVDAPDLSDLVSQPGPFLSLVLTTEAEIDNAAHRNELRWRQVRDELSGQGAPGDLLAQVDALVPEAHLKGQTLVVVGGPHGPAHVGQWPTRPFRELARWAPVPSLGPVLERRQEFPAHVLVVADRNGADITAVRHDAARLQLEAGHQEEALPRVHAGGWSERRFQERAQNSWAHNARDVAHRVADLVDRVDARLVIVAGDVRALQLLRADLPDDVAALVAEVEGSRAADGAPDVHPAQVERLLAEVVARDTAAMVEKLAEEVGQHDRGRVGVAGTIAALSAAQVQVLLVRDDPDDERTAWFGDDPLVAGLRRSDLDGLVEHPQEGRLVDVLIRSALAGGAGVRILPAGCGVEEGVGGILRWA